MALHTAASSAWNAATFSLPFPIAQSAITRSPFAAFQYAQKCHTLKPDENFGRLSVLLRVPPVTPNPSVRVIRADELSSLLSLYRYLHPSDPELPLSAAVEELWQRINADPNHHYLGVEVSGTLVSTCTLAIIPNLTRSARPYGLIENVVTHPDFRRQGIGTALLRFALQLAWTNDCYKVTLLTGRQEPATLRFYEQAGFRAGVKTGFIATPTP